MDPNTSLSGLLIGLPIGAVLVWLLLRSRHRAEQAQSLAELRERELIEARAA